MAWPGPESWSRNRRRPAQRAGHSRTSTSPAGQDATPGLGGEGVDGHAGHDDIGQQQVDVYAGIAQHAERLRLPGSRHDQIAGPGQDQVRNLADRCLVVHQRTLLACSAAVAGRSAASPDLPSAAAGSSSVTMVPLPGSDRSHAWPPARMANLPPADRPSPAAWPPPVEVKNGSKARSAVFASMPRPVSLTVSRT